MTSPHEKQWVCFPSTLSVLVSRGNFKTHWYDKMVIGYWQSKGVLNRKIYFVGPFCTFELLKQLFVYLMLKVLQFTQGSPGRFWTPEVCLWCFTGIWEGKFYIMLPTGVCEKENGTCKLLLQIVLRYFFENNCYNSNSVS